MSARLRAFVREGYSLDATVPYICLIAFLLRLLGSRLSGHFMAYKSYYDIARNVVAGAGYCVEPGKLCAYFPPVYPTVLAGCLLTGDFHAAVVAVSALLGAALVYLTWLIGRRLFGSATGFLAATYCAVYPYYVWHDTVVQENVTLAFVTALSVWCLLHASVSAGWSLSAGIVLGLCVLTKANMLLFALASPLWLWLVEAKFGKALCVYGGLLLVVVPWLVRSQRVVGAPVIYSVTGFALWTANHRLTFDYFPVNSIDQARLPELADLSAPQKQELGVINARDPNGIEESRWFWNLGIAYIRTHPWPTLAHAIRKLGIAFSPIFSPRKGLAEQLAYAFSYLPLLLGSVVGLLWSRERWRQVGYLYIMLLSYGAASAVFWAHTSHRMYLEPYLMLFAAYALLKTLERTLQHRDS